MWTIGNTARTFRDSAAPDWPSPSREELDKANELAPARLGSLRNVAECEEASATLPRHGVA